MVLLVAKSAWPILLIVPGIISLLVVIFVVTSVMERRRREALAKFASEHSYGYNEDATQVLSQHIGGLRLFNIGHGRDGRNLIYGDLDGLQFWVFDYRYSIGGGKSRQTHRQTVAVYHLPGRQFPPFDCRPEHFFHKIGEAFGGYKDIDFDSDETFSKRYLLQGAHEGTMRAAFHHDVRRQICELEPLCIEGAGEWVMFYRPGRRIAVEQIPTLLTSTTPIAHAMGSAPELA